MSMKVDPGNHTRWKHKWESGTNRVWVWHNTASEWSGEEQRRRCQCEERIKRDSVRAFFAHVTWMEDFPLFPKGGVEPESNTNVTPKRAGKKTLSSN